VRLLELQSTDMGQQGMQVSTVTLETAGKD
jgi:hypothetical protein